ncbi:uncharacterized protein LOC118264530 [Spodoptera frugiperda]|uniref:Uncharacterized protein LOC118264530 n=1 Tax=Spodoptera frugiperda TaxID=7108 RepID=A0A9R0CXY0_SPOFR|nr:uncharacterized protein LOC118264530 [Spodoptera frugiperda]
MNKNVFLVTFLLHMSHVYYCIEDPDRIDVVDMTKPTTWRDLAIYYGAVEKHWKMCINCGVPDLGTGIHLEHTGSTGSMHPAVIPSEYLLSRLSIVDVSTLTTLNPSVVLTLDVALQWAALKHDPKEPTLLLFKFGWTEEDNSRINVGACVCKVPGLSYELAEWIAANLSHVVGVATDTPTFESEQTREFASRTVSNVLGRSGIYMIENVHFRRKMPEQGCMALAMPLKLLNAPYVPTRLTAFCPSTKSDLHVVMALKKEIPIQTRLPNSRVYDVNLDEILS